MLKYILLMISAVGHGICFISTMYVTNDVRSLEAVVVMCINDKTGYIYTSVIKVGAQYT